MIWLFKMTPKLLFLRMLKKKFALRFEGESSSFWCVNIAQRAVSRLNYKIRYVMIEQSIYFLRFKFIDSKTRETLFDAQYSL